MQSKAIAPDVASSDCITSAEAQSPFQKLIRPRPGLYDCVQHCSCQSRHAHVDRRPDIHDDVSSLFLCRRLYLLDSGRHNVPLPIELRLRLPRRHGIVLRESIVESAGHDERQEAIPKDPVDNGSVAVPKWESGPQSERSTSMKFTDSPSSAPDFGIQRNFALWEPVSVILGRKW
jgi:hypothetical protein